MCFFSPIYACILKNTFLQISEFLMCKPRSIREGSPLVTLVWKNIFGEVSTFCLWTDWIQLVVLLVAREISVSLSLQTAVEACSTKSEIYTFDRCPHGRSSQEYYWESENNQTVFETCVLNPFHGQKISANIFSKGNREDRSWRERHLIVKSPWTNHRNNNSHFCNDPL